MREELLRAHVELLARHPEDFDMRVGVERRPRSVWEWLRGDCGTVCCLAGQVYLSSRNSAPREVAHLRVGHQLGWDRVSHDAAKILGLTDLQAARLFHYKNWPGQLAYKYVLANSGLERVAVLREAVEDFIATNGWEPGPQAAPEVKISIQDGQLVES